jgi:hypothetical protein
MKRFSLKISKGRLKIEGLVQQIGNDILVSLWGGTRPHIGAVGMAVPRPSLSNPKKWSATSSSYTFIGHKEDLLVKEVSEKLTSRLKRNVVVTAGLHWDGLTPAGVKAVEGLVRKISDQILRRIPSSSGTGPEPSEEK